MRMEVGEGEVMWEPSRKLLEESRIAEFIRWLSAERGLGIAGYEELWQWSVDDLDGFWRAIWDYFEVIADGSPEPVLGSREMPGAEWFPGARLNYAEHVFRDRAPGDLAIRHVSETRGAADLTWDELEAQVGACAAGLRAMGVGEGDRVASLLPNIAEAVVAFLAVTSIGAVWSSCSPDFGTSSVVDRFAQIEPKVLIAPDGYRYGGRDFDRRDALAEIVAAIPSLERLIFLDYLGVGQPATEARPTVAWEELLASHAGAALEFARVPFVAPLWILYSSGTTGVPKAIVQSQGGILLEHLKALNLQNDLRAGDRLFWFTTTGWMMWNFLVSGLLTPAAIVLFDGNPGHPDLGVLWDLAESARVTTFGTSASFIGASMKREVEPARGRDLSALRAIGSTGSPLSPDGFDWVAEQFGADLWLFSSSGGTDICTTVIGGVPILPVRRGELQGRALGVAVEAWSEAGEPLDDEVGELVITKPMPSMPIYFWDDPGDERYREAYFESFPGVWRHGDWLRLTRHGGGVIYGRSDSTINRGGIRMGTAEIYRAVLELEPILDALVVDVLVPGTHGWMPLFVVLAAGETLDDELREAIASQIRNLATPRHVPDVIRQVDGVPRTLTGKLVEVPIKRILGGASVEGTVSRDSLANPEALDYFVRFAREEVPAGAADPSS